MGLDMYSEKNFNMDVSHFQDMSPIYSDTGSSSSTCSLARKELSLEPPHLYMDDEGYFDALEDYTNLLDLGDRPRYRDFCGAVQTLLRCSGGRSIAEPRPLHPTAYLDGLRGVAAFIVFIHHYTLFSFLGGMEGYNSNGSSTTRWFLQLPIIRLIHSGRPMVSVFFIISGFALSYKPLQLIRSQSHSALLKNLASSVFRRPIRLFLPLIPTTLIGVFLIYYRIWIKWVNPQESLGGQLMDWSDTITHMVFPFHWDMTWPDYDDHLWTIPVEYRGSLVVFLTLLGLGTTKPALRISVVSFIALVCFQRTRWECTLFLAGIVLAEWTLIRAEDELPALPIRLETQQPADNLFTLSPRILSIIKVSGLFIGLLLLSVSSLEPKGYLRPAVYRFLLLRIPQQYMTIELIEWYYIVPGSILLLVSMVTLPVLQRPFTTPIAQYLGHISYALYIVHGPVFRTFYVPVVARMWKIIGAWDSTADTFVHINPWNISPVQPPNSGLVGDLAYMTGPVMGACILMPVAMAIAHLFWKCVDKPSVVIAKNVANWATMNS